MKAAAIAALSLLVVLPVQAAQHHRRNASPIATCDNDGHCTMSRVAAASAASKRTSARKSHTVTAATKPTADAGSSTETAAETAKITTTEAASSAVDTAEVPKVTAKAATAAAPATGALDANGNKAAGVVVSTKTGARARVGVAHAARFQAYIDDLEKNHGSRVLFMGGIRPGRCAPASEHPCGKALDVCQLRRGVVDSRCNLPDRVTLGRIAAAHGLFEGGRWCHSDYGHAQIDVTAAACGDTRIRMVRRAAAEPVGDTPRP
jgi:hypothetical protein